MTSVVSDSLQPLDYSLAASSVHGILQARILEWVAMQPMGRTLGDLPDRGIELASLTSPAMVGGFFIRCHLGRLHISLHHLFLLSSYKLPSA